MGSIYHIQAVSINGGTMAGVRGVLAERGWNDLSAGSDGTIHETLQAEMSSRPAAELRTIQVGSWLTLLSGSVEAPCVTIASCFMYGGKAATDMVGYASGSVHERWAATAGLLYLTGISWSDGDVAELTARALFHSAAGGTDPLVRTLVALPTLPVPAEAWTVTGLTVGGVAVPLLKRVSLSVDPKATQRGDAGLPFPTACYGAGPNGQAEFRLEFETEDMSAVGVGLVTGAVVVTFTQYAQGGTLSATTKVLTLNNCLLRDVSGPISGSQGSVATRSWLARPRYDGVNLPLTIA